MKQLTNELIGTELDTAFCMALDIDVKYSPMQGVIQEGPIDHWNPFRPSSDITVLWRYIVQRRIELSPRQTGGWQAQCWKPYGVGSGPSPEAAACRAVVNSVYGEYWETRIYPQ